MNQFNVNNQLTLFGATPDSYDANGNLIQEGTATSYFWDGRNRLKSILTAAGQTTNFTYDFAGNLIIQADAGSTLNLTKSFVLDSLTNVAYEAASDGTSYSVLSGRSIDSHLAVAQSTGQVQYPLADAINSTVATTDQTGAIKSQFLYEPFGQTTTASSYPFQFNGRMLVSPTTYYYRARFYNSQTGRFISEDPIGFAGLDPNLYRYAQNNPVLLTDPSGKISIVEGIVILAGAAALFYELYQLVPAFSKYMNESNNAIPTGDTTAVNLAGQSLAYQCQLTTSTVSNLPQGADPDSVTSYFTTEAPSWLQQLWNLMVGKQ
jgi:RHS repeat-associated protein